MEHEKIQPSSRVTRGEKSNFTQVTPLSKYLAMTLFILIPFIGGWVGYYYAPEKTVKIVEIEKILVTDIENSIDAEMIEYSENTAGENGEADVVDGEDDWIIYENDFYRLHYPKDCVIKDYLTTNKDSEWLSTTVSYIGVCDMGSASLRSIRVTTDPVDKVIKFNIQNAKLAEGQALISTETTKVGLYNALKMNFKNERTSYEYFVVVFSLNGFTFVIDGVKSEYNWDMNKILSSISVK